MANDSKLWDLEKTKRSRPVSHLTRLKYTSLLYSTTNICCWKCVVYNLLPETLQWSVISYSDVTSPLKYKKLVAWQRVFPVNVSTLKEEGGGGGGLAQSTQMGIFPAGGDVCLLSTLLSAMVSYLNLTFAIAFQEKDSEAVTTTWHSELVQAWGFLEDPVHFDDTRVTNSSEWPCL